MTEDIIKLRMREVNNIANDLGLDKDKLKACTEIIFKFINEDFSAVNYDVLYNNDEINKIIAKSILEDINLNDLKRFVTLHRIMVEWGIIFKVVDGRLKLSLLK